MGIKEELTKQIKLDSPVVYFAKFITNMKLVISAAILATFCGAFTIDKKEAQSHLRSIRASKQNIIDLATVDAKTGAGALFWKNLERECVEEQCGLEEAIETYEEFGAKANIQTLSAGQQSYDKYVNEYVSNHLDTNGLRDSVAAEFEKFYTNCYQSWKDADDKENKPGLTQMTFTTDSDNTVNGNGFKIQNVEGSLIDVWDRCIKNVDPSKSVQGFISNAFNIWMFEHVE